MIIDAGNRFSSSQAVTVDALATNVIDLGVARDLAAGEPMCVAIAVVVAADATSGDETYAFNIETDDNAAMSSPTVLSVTTISRTLLTIGSLHIIGLPFVLLERFLALRYDTGGTTPTITVSAWLAPLSTIQKYRSYPDNLTIS